MSKQQNLDSENNRVQADNEDTMDEARKLAIQRFNQQIESRIDQQTFGATYPGDPMAEMRKSVWKKQIATLDEDLGDYFADQADSTDTLSLQDSLFGKQSDEDEINELLGIDKEAYLAEQLNQNTPANPDTATSATPANVIAPDVNKDLEARLAQKEQEIAERDRVLRDLLVKEQLEKDSLIAAYQNVFEENKTLKDTINQKPKIDAQKAAEAKKAKIKAESNEIYRMLTNAEEGGAEKLNELLVSLIEDKQSAEPAEDYVTKLVEKRLAEERQKDYTNKFNEARTKFEQNNKDLLNDEVQFAVFISNYNKINDDFKKQGKLPNPEDLFAVAKARTDEKLSGYKKANGVVQSPSVNIDTQLEEEASRATQSRSAAPKNNPSGSTTTPKTAKLNPESQWEQLQKRIGARIVGR